jgi:hypothetical protein
MAKRVQCSSSLLTILWAQETRDWHNIVTLDKLWFYYIADHGLILFFPHGKMPDLERVTVQSTKVMLPIMWDPNAFAVVTAIESECKFNAGYCVSKILTPLPEWLCEGGGGNFGDLRVHANNARLHKSAVSQQFIARNSMAIAVRPPIHRIWLLLTFTYSVI